MSIYAQYPDVTEYEYEIDITPDNIGRVRTEFAFYLGAMKADSCAAQDIGKLKPVSCMNNWWPTHAGETRLMTLYWGRAIHDNGEPQAAGRQKWSWRYLDGNRWTSICKDLAASGCGFKLSEPPLSKIRFHRYFTLLRMPLTLKNNQVKWMAANNYRLLDTGRLATFWINGWKPEEYSIEKEFDYFKTTKEEWRKHGRDGY